jgi:hypothetical protein
MAAPGERNWQDCLAGGGVLGARGQETGGRVSDETAGESTENPGDFPPRAPAQPRVNYRSGSGLRIQTAGGVVERVTGGSSRSSPAVVTLRTSAATVVASILRMMLAR